MKDSTLLRLTRISNPPAVLNFETILNHSSKLTYLPSSGNTDGERTPSEHSQEMFSSFHASFKMQAGYTSLNRVEKVKSGIAQITDRISKVFVKAEKENLNVIKVRDFGSIKTIDKEVMAMHEFPKAEVINLNLINLYSDYSIID